MRSILAFLVVIAAYGCSVPLVAVAAPNEASVRHSLELALSDCRGWAAAPFYLEWTVQKTYRPDDQTLRSLIAEVENAPDHPERSAVESYIRRVAGTDPMWESAVWFWSPAEFRVHRSAPGPRAEMYRSDKVRSKSAAWNMSPLQLSVYDHDRLPVHALPESALRTFQYDISYFLYPGMLALVLSEAPSSRVSLRVSMTGPESWKAIGTVELNAPYQVGLSGGWDHASDSARVEGIRLIVASPSERPDSDQLPVTYELSDHVSTPLSFGSGLVPRRVRVLNFREREIEVRTLVALRTIDRLEFDVVTRRPSAESPDKIYGWPESVRILHFGEEGEERLSSNNESSENVQAGRDRPATHLWHSTVLYFGLTCGLIAASVAIVKRRFFKK